METKEIWKDIEGYEGYYQVSNLARVKSLSRFTGTNKTANDNILKPTLDNYGYFKVQLCKDSQIKNCKVHRLVAIAFIPNSENKPFINHINSNKKDNRIENLEWCNNRENMTHYHLTQNTTSKYTGVHWCKKNNKWIASIKYKNKTIRLGYSDIEYDAHLMYQKALNEINKGVFKEPIHKYSSQYKGVCYDINSGKWVSYARHKGKVYNTGRYWSEIDAYNASQKKLSELNLNIIHL